MNSTTLDYQSPPDPPSPPEQLPKGIYQCGTLRYTTFGLIMLFVWLLWGDFIWTLMDGAVPDILPLKLTDLGASDTLNQILTGTFGYAIIFIFAPVASVASDRHRGPWGRRIPYLFWSTPFVGLFLILMGCYQNLTNQFMGHHSAMHLFGHYSIGRPAFTLIIFAVVYIGYDFANIFVSTVYWYLFNDVVPSPYLSRFMSLFRVVGNGAQIAYNLWVLPHAMTHFRLIFVIAGIAYVVGFMLMCVFIREGEYPPPEPVTGTEPGVIGRIIAMCKLYARECFTHRFYWFFFLANTFSLFSYRAARLTRNRDNLSLGLSLDQLGKVASWTLVISLLMQYPAGWLSDKYNPIRVYIVTRFLSLLGILAQFVWIFKDFGVHGNLVYMYWISFAFLPFGVLSDAAEIPMYMRMLPRDRYGQFCSANAMLRAFAAIFGSALSGMFLDLLRRHEFVTDWHYRYIPVWTIVFQVPAMYCLVLLYKEWKNLGGNTNFVPP